jgi:hypothetical protein
VILAGRRSVWALKLADGAPAWDGQTVQLPAGSSPSGSGFLSGDYYYLPLSSAEVLAIDLAAGRTAHAYKSRRGVVPGNLVCYGGLVVSQRAGAVDLFHQLDALSKDVDRRLAAHADDPEALTQRGEILWDEGKLKEAREFLSTIEPKDVRLVWEARSPSMTESMQLMQEFSIVHCVDLSREKPSFDSDVIYTRLFGKGKHNIYQFTDEELIEIDDRIEEFKPKIVAMSYHGLRMNTDAARFKQYRGTGAFLPVTSFTGVDSARQVMSEDARFPSSKAELIEHQGWKVIDLTSSKRVHLSELLSQIPDKTYSDLDEVIRTMRVD